eukprot:3298064-Pleurochrysis_carterae.AAC.1
MCYRAVLERNRELLLRGAGTVGTGPSFNNVSMMLRHCCNHPWLIPDVEDGALAQLDREWEEVEAAMDEAEEEAEGASGAVARANGRGVVAAGASAVADKSGKRDKDKEREKERVKEEEERERERARDAERTRRYTERLVSSSGKFVLLEKLLPKLKREGHRVLIFSQARAEGAACARERAHAHTHMNAGDWDGGCGSAPALVLGGAEGGR